MELQDAIDFITPALPRPQSGKVWADLGCGQGLFSHALAELLENQSTVHAIDTVVEKSVTSVNGNTISFHPLNFDHDALPFSQLDGILMANSLHYIQDKRRLFMKLNNHLKSTGKLLVIEYEMASPNPWVPYPVSFVELRAILTEEGFHNIQRVNERQSIYGGRTMYACLAEKP